MSHLCQLLADWRGEMPAGGAYIEEKHDGWRCLRFAGRDGVTRLWTRQGLPLEGADHIAYHLDLIERAAGEPLFFDGEIVVDGSLAATKDWFERGWKRGDEAGVLHLFDAMPYREWARGGSATPLHRRQARLAEWLKAAIGDGWDWRPGSRGRDEGKECVRMISSEYVETPSEALDFARRIWARGGEGAVVKCFDAPYQRKRHADWQKIKVDGPWRRTLSPTAL